MEPHQTLEKRIESDAIRWLLGAGILAVALCCFLVISDNRLTHSKREQELGETLRELRSAQAGLPARVLDQRQVAID